MSTPQVFPKSVTFPKGIVPAEADGSPATAPAATIKVAQGSDLAVMPRRIRLTLTEASIAVLEADGFGSLEFAGLPTNPIALMAVKTDLVLTKDGVGFIAATDLNVAIGTTAATAADLTTTPSESDVVDVAAFTASALAPAVDLHSASNAAPAITVMASGAKSLFLNVAGATETGEDASVSVSGSIDITWMDLG